MSRRYIEVGSLHNFQLNSNSQILIYMASLHQCIYLALTSNVESNPCRVNEKWVQSLGKCAKIRSFRLT